MTGTALHYTACLLLLLNVSIHFSCCCVFVNREDIDCNFITISCRCYCHFSYSHFRCYFLSRLLWHTLCCSLLMDNEILTPLNDINQNGDEEEEE